MRGQSRKTNENKGRAWGSCEKRLERGEVVVLEQVGFCRGWARASQTRQDEKEKEGQ